MRRLAFFLSGEHETLPVSEVIGGIEAENYEYELDEELDQVLIVKTEADSQKLAERLGMCHWVGEHFFTSRIDDLVECLGSSDLVDFLPQSESISVRVKRVKEYLPEVDTQDLSEKIADKLLEKFDYEIDLEYPENKIVAVLTEDRCVLVIIKAEVDRSSLSDRKPPKRARVHPSTMQPNFARMLVNLARTPRNGTFLDPFCGIGGILIEAGLIGADLIGVDINSELVERARENLEDIGIKDFNLRVGDSTKIEVGEVDAIATDPPYGRQASTGGSDLENLYKNSIPVLAKSLKTGGYMCITAPTGIDMQKTIENQPLTMKEKHQQRVHKSLTRTIYVFKKVEN